MKIYSYDAQGNFVEAFEAQLDQLESKKKGSQVFLLPANATFVAPGKPKVATNRMVWNGRSWIETEPAPDAVFEIPDPNESVRVKPPTEAELKEQAELEEKMQQTLEKAGALRKKLLSVRAEGITAKNAPTVLADLIDLVLA